MVQDNVFRSGDLYGTELVHEKVLRSEHLYWPELLQDNAFKSKDVYWTELVQDKAIRSGHLYWTEVIQDNAFRSKDLYWTELFHDKTLRSGDLYWTELVPDKAIRSGDWCWTEMVQDKVFRNGFCAEQISFRISCWGAGICIELNWFRIMCSEREFHGHRLRANVIKRNFLIFHFVPRSQGPPHRPTRAKAVWFLTVCGKVSIPNKKAVFFLSPPCPGRLWTRHFTGYRRLYHQLCSGQDVNLTADFLLISRSKIPDVQLHLSSSHYSYFPPYFCFVLWRFRVWIWFWSSVILTQVCHCFPESNQAMQGLQKFCFTCFPLYYLIILPSDAASAEMLNIFLK